MNSVSFDKVLEENSVNSLKKTTQRQWAVYGASGCWMALMPTSIYVSPMFDVPLGGGAAQFFLLSLVCGGLLALAYRTVALKVLILKVSERPAAPKANDKVLKKERDEAQAAAGQQLADECSAYALFVVNAAFVCLWLLCAFSFLPRAHTGVPSKLNHALAVTLPAGLFAWKGKILF